MKVWKLVLTGAVLTATIITPKGPEARLAKVTPEPHIAPLAKLTVEKPAVLTEGASRSPVTAYAVAQKPLQGIRIVVDPGHGGQTRLDKLFYCGGTLGAATGQTESDVNLRVALILREYLRAAGADVIMTRIDDVRVSGAGSKANELDMRRELANGRSADLFVSVHHNEALRGGTNYSAVFYPGASSSSIPLAENISASLNQYLRIPNVGAKVGAYRVLNGLKMPGVIVEASFMSNPDEDRRLMSLAYNKLEAKAIATGVMNFIRMKHGRQIDFNTVFAPIDDKSGNAQSIADASYVRREIVERKSLFGVRYEEITYDSAGRVTDIRAVGSDNPLKKATAVAAAAAKTGKGTSSKKVVATAAGSKKSSSIKITPAKSSDSAKSDIVSVADTKDIKAVVTNGKPAKLTKPASKSDSTKNNKPTKTTAKSSSKSSSKSSKKSS